MEQQQQRDSVQWCPAFYSNGKPPTIQHRYTAEEINHGFLVSQDNCSEKAQKGSKQFALFRNWAHFQQYSSTQQNHHFYEVIQGHQPQKLNFDGDDMMQAELDFPLVLKAIHDIFATLFATDLGPHNLVICSSHGIHKRSWHVIVDGYYVANNTQAKAFYDIVWACAPQTLTSKGTPCLDPSVYSSFQNFRMLGSTKKDDISRVKALDHQSRPFHFEQTLITHIDGP
jgi:hypothetical protein